MLVLLHIALNLPDLPPNLKRRTEIPWACWISRLPRCSSGILKRRTATLFASLEGCGVKATKPSNLKRRTATRTPVQVSLRWCGLGISKGERQRYVLNTSSGAPPTAFWISKGERQLWRGQVMPLATVPAESQKENGNLGLLSQQSCPACKPLRISKGERQRTLRANSAT